MSIDSASKKRRLLTTALLLAIFMLGMALRVYGLDADTLRGDEITTHRRTRFDVSSLMAHLASSAAYDQGPVVYLVTHFSVARLGDSDFVLRLQAMLFGSLSILLVFKVGQILWGRGVGLVGALLLAVNPYHIQYSQTARHYSLMVFLALLSLVFLLKALEKSQIRMWLAFVICTSLSLYNHYFAFLFLPAEIIFATWVIAEGCLPYRGKDGHSSHPNPSSMVSSAPKQGAMFTASLCLVAISYLPWLPMLQALISRELGSQRPVGMSLDGLHTSFTFLHTALSDYGNGDGIARFAWPALFLLGLTACGLKRSTLVLLWMGVPFAFLALAASGHSLDSRYVLFILPLYLLVIAHGVIYIGRFSEKRLRNLRHGRKYQLAVIYAVTMAIPIALSLTRLPHYYGRPKRDWRSTAAYLKVKSSPDDLVLYPGWGTYNVVGDTLQIYLRRCGVEALPVLQVKRGLGQALAWLGDATGQVTAVVYPEDVLFSDQAISQITRVDFEGVSVIQLLEPSGDVLRDTVSMLQMLTYLLPAPETRFDAHLVLADVYMRTGRFEQAQLHIELASQMKPDTPRASRHLTRTRAEFDQLAHGLDKGIEHPIWRSLGLQTALLGYDLDAQSIGIGETLDITLWWQALTDMDRDYTAFIHLLGPDNRIWAQQDMLLEEGGLTTSAWEMGQVVKDEYRLELAPHAPAGEYIMLAGIYYWETGERLPVWDEQGERATDAVITLGSITIINSRKPQMSHSGLDS